MMSAVIVSLLGTRRRYARFDVELPLDERHARRAVRLHVDCAKEVALWLVGADQKTIVLPVGVRDAGRTRGARSVVLTFREPAVAALEREAGQSLLAVHVDRARAADASPLRLSSTTPAGGHLHDQDHEKQTNDVPRMDHGE